MSTIGIVLAAGSATRYGGVPKVLEVHNGKPLFMHAVDALRPVSNYAVVVAPSKDSAVAHAVWEYADANAIEQPTPTGTGDALRVALESGAAEHFDWMLCTFADKPGVTPGVFYALMAEQDFADADCVFAVADMPGNTSKGRE